MPYDPRPLSEGGNRGVDEAFSRNAPKGKFRVIGVDTFDGTDWVEGDYDTLEFAQKVAQAQGGSMCMMHVYDDRGKHVDKAGTF